DAAYSSSARLSSTRRDLLVCPPGSAGAPGADDRREKLETPGPIAAQYVLALLAAAVAATRMAGAAAGSRRCARGVVASTVSSHGRHRAGPRPLPVSRGFSVCAARAVWSGKAVRAGRLLLPRVRAARG